jgi:hypothetical protein
LSTLVRVAPQPPPWGLPYAAVQRAPHPHQRTYHRRVLHIAEEVKIIAARSPRSSGERTARSVLQRSRSDRLGHGLAAKHQHRSAWGRERPAAAILAGHPGCAMVAPSDGGAVRGGVERGWWRWGWVGGQSVCYFHLVSSYWFVPSCFAFRPITKVAAQRHNAHCFYKIAVIFLCAHKKSDICWCVSHLVILL